MARYHDYEVRYGSSNKHSSPAAELKTVRRTCTHNGHARLFSPLGASDLSSLQALLLTHPGRPLAVICQTDDGTQSASGRSVGGLLGRASQGELSNGMPLLCDRMTQPRHGHAMGQTGGDPWKWRGDGGWRFLSRGL
ncbi:hypothetical protein G7046_g4917 [Stylonectria norvegica]|nr:hypothetical protein G7046_g4917 [Stylonectria norvegica]